MLQNKSLSWFGGVSFIIAGVLFFVNYVLTFQVPNPPPSGPDLLRWLSDWKFDIAMSNEVFFFAVICLVPSVFALFRALVSIDEIKTMVGCGVFAMVLPILGVLDIVQGRLVYPVYGISLSPDVLQLVLSIYYGGLHATSLLIGLATIVLSFAMRRSTFGKLTFYLGLTTGVFDFTGAYPWLIGSVLEFVSQLLFSIWFIVVGFKIMGIHTEKIETNPKE